MKNIVDVFLNHVAKSKLTNAVTLVAMFALTEAFVAVINHN